jgi:hypothetical protein
MKTATRKRTNDAISSNVRVYWRRVHSSERMTLARKPVSRQFSGLSRRPKLTVARSQVPRGLLGDKDSLGFSFRCPRPEHLRDRAACNAPNIAALDISRVALIGPSMECDERGELGLAAVVWPSETLSQVC